MQAAFFFFYTTDTRKETSQISFLLRFRCFWYVEDVTRRTWMHGIWQKRAEQCGLTMVCVGPAENAVWSHDNHPHVRYKKNLFSVFISEGRTCTLYLEIFSTFLIHSWFILDSTFWYFPGEELKKHVHTLTVKGAQGTTLCTLCIRLACLVERLHIWEGILIQAKQSGSTQFLSSVLRF